MPAHINYETTPIIFYKFVCENPEIKSCYVGHTTNFQQRKCSHKSNCYNKNNVSYNFKIYQTIRENGGFSEWKMVEIDRQLCLDKSDACKIEQKYIEELQTNMNMRNSYTDQKQYIIDNKERISEQKKQYRLNNRSKLCEQKKQYYLNNKETISESRNKWILNNKERYYENRNQQKICDCGNHYTQSNYARHNKSKKHLEYLETLNITL